LVGLKDKIFEEEEHQGWENQKHLKGAILHIKKAV